jgi:hypothetical protein
MPQERPSDEAQRYREAAEQVLDQLDWCVSYLREIHKPEIARAIARNQRHIRDRLEEADASRRRSR